MIKYFITIIVLVNCVCSPRANASTITAASASLLDVQTAISSAASGDIVVVPAGSAIWNSALSINKGITLKGNGIDSTIIISSGGSNIISYSPAAPSLNEKFRLTGFTLNGNGRNVKGVYAANPSTTYTLNNIRIDHNKIIACSARSVEINGMIYGLIDNNIITGTNSNNRILAIYGKDAYSWLDPLQIGTSNYTYIESNTISNGEALVASYGARWVFRYNDIYANSCQPSLDAHGNLTCYPSCQWDCVRGQVAAEVYENTWHGLTGGCKIIDHRSGTGFIYNNKADSTMGPGNTTIRLREEDSSSASYLASCYPIKTVKPGYDPIINTYVWGNTVSILGAPPVNIRMYWNEYNEMDLITEKTDYWTDTAIGSSADTGYITKGLGSAHPEICSDNDVYWETDNKKLYRCIGSNNWTFIYSPYTYPHPMTLVDTQAATPPKAPKKLRVK